MVAAPPFEALLVVTLTLMYTGVAALQGLEEGRLQVLGGKLEQDLEEVEWTANLLKPFQILPPGIACPAAAWR